jgi:hypothetical protein
MLWPVVALIGFLVLMALIIALGTRSTELYERAEQGQASAAQPLPSPPAAAEPPDW